MPRGAAGGEVITSNAIVYVLRSFPELSETFIRNEIQGLRRAGVPVRVIALEEASQSGITGMAHRAATDVVFLTGPRAAEARRAPRGGPLRLLSPMLRDLLRLKLHPRRSARCARLAYHAARAAGHVPARSRRLHAHFANDAATLARYVSVLTGVPYVVTAHAYDIYRDPFLLEPNLARAAHVFTVSSANRDHLVAVMARSDGPGDDRVSVLHCGVDLDAFDYRDPPAPKARAHLLCVARLVPKKGHDILVDALSRLVGGGTPARLTLAGQGPEAESLRRRVADRGLEGAVDLLGAVPPDRIPGLMREADAVVLAARVADDGDRDGIPVALIEASAIGVPVVATAVSGIPELVTPESGWLVEPERPDLFADELRAALTESGERRVARARLARQRVEAEFDLGRQIRILRDLAP